MKLLSKDGVNSKDYHQYLKNGLFVFLYCLYSYQWQDRYWEFISTASSQQKDGDIPTNVVSDYIINTRLWASTQNLAPSSDTGGDVPDGKPTSEIKFVDTDYEPSKNLQ